MTQATIPMIESPTPVGRPMMRDKFCCTGSRVVGGAVGVAVGDRTVEGEEILDCNFKSQFYVGLCTTDLASSPGHSQKSWTVILRVSFLQSLPQAPPSRNNNKNIQSHLLDLHGTRNLASSPGHSQISSHNSGEKSAEFSSQLRDKIWEWPGDEGTRDQCSKHFQQHVSSRKNLI